MAKKKSRKRPYQQPPHEVENRRERLPGDDRRATRKPAQRDAKGRPVRPVEPPSWSRSLKRLPLVFLLFFGLQYFLSGALGATSDLDVQDRLIRAAFQSGMMAVVFVPLSYYLDRMMYGMYLRRSGQTPAGKRSKQDAAQQDTSDDDSSASDGADSDGDAQDGRDSE